MSTKGSLYNRRANVKLYSVVQFCFLEIDTQNNIFLLKWFLDIILRFLDAKLHVVPATRRLMYFVHTSTHGFGCTEVKEPEYYKSHL